MSLFHSTKQHQFKLDQIVKNKIINSIYFKDSLYALTSETFIEKSIEINHIGGTYSSNSRPTKFLCLVYKLFYINPEKEILYEYLNNESFKYLTAITAFYIRLTFKHTDIYKVLEPLLKDYRKLRVRGGDGRFYIITMDSYIDDLLNKEEVFGISLPFLKRREILVEEGVLDEYSTFLNVISFENKENSDLNIVNDNILADWMKSEGYPVEYEASVDEDFDNVNDKGKIGNIIEKKEGKEVDDNEKDNEFSLDYWNEIRKKIGLGEI